MVASSLGGTPPISLSTVWVMHHVVVELLVAGLLFYFSVVVLSNLNFHLFFNIISSSLAWFVLKKSLSNQGS